MKFKNITYPGLLTSLIILVASSGCLEYAAPTEVQPAIQATQANGQQNEIEATEKRFEESDLRPTAVESAIQLSEKYAKLSEETAELKKQNEVLTEENRSLKDLLNQSRAQLTQTQKELEQANDLLIEMRIELNNWKTDILGFRQEMREADKAQLETLFKVLQVLGGEVKDESPQAEDTNSVTISQDDITKPVTQTQ